MEKIKAPAEGARVAENGRAHPASARFARSRPGVPALAPSQRTGRALGGAKEVGREGLGGARRATARDDIEVERLLAHYDA